MKEFFGGLRKAEGSGSTEIIEKDYHLHRLLHRISQNKYLNDNLVFKGGTCLVKAYTGYYRFSEDIDFTRRQDATWQEMMNGGASKHCSTEITKIVREFKGISDNLRFGFSGDKSRDMAKGGDVNIRAGGKMVDLWLRYDSEVLEIPVSVKIQVNLVDLIQFPIVNIPLRSYVDGIDMEELRRLYGEPCAEYCREITLPCYDSREIFTEKCRAAMTRIVYKPRDILDIYMMEREFGYSIGEYRNAIIEKTKYMLDMYDKYRKSIESMEFPDEHVLTNAEEKLLLRRLPPDFIHEAVRIHNQLKPLRQEILSM